MFTFLMTLLFTYLFTYLFRQCLFRVRQLLHLHHDLKLKRDYPLLIIKFIKWKVIIEEIHLMEVTKHQGKYLDLFHFRRLNTIHGTISIIFYFQPSKMKFVLIHMGYMDKFHISHGSFFGKIKVSFLYGFAQLRPLALITYQFELTQWRASDRFQNWCCLGGALQPTVTANHKLSYKKVHLSLSLRVHGDLGQKVSSSKFIFNYSQSIWSIFYKMALLN